MSHENFINLCKSYNILPDSSLTRSKITQNVVLKTQYLKQRTFSAIFEDELLTK